MGLTAKQQDVLGQIAFGADGGHHPATLAVLLKRGLIERLPDRVVGRDVFGVISAPQYEVPLPVHMELCQWCADNLPLPEIETPPALSSFPDSTKEGE